MLNLNLDTKQKYLLAVSGGVDSTSLFFALLAQKINFEVVHINHHTRGAENAREQKFVEEIAKTNKIVVHVRDFYFSGTGNFHEAARRFRLDCYKQICKHQQLAGVILAHHLDDVWETIMMNQGAVLPRMLWPKSQQNNLTIFRPWLNYPKSLIIKEAKKSGIIWYEDSSNQSQKYLRNQMRMIRRSLPEKEQEIKRVTQKHHLSKEYEKIDLTKENYLKVIDKHLFLYTKIKQKLRLSLSYQLIDDLVALIDFQGYKQYNLPGQFYFVQSYNEIKITKKRAKPTSKKIKVQQGINVFNGIGFTCSHARGFIRAKEPGDKITIAGGHKKISRVMVDAKIPRDKRDCWPIIVDENNQIVKVITPQEVLFEE